MGSVTELLVASLTVVLVAGSVWLLVTAVRALGQDFSLTARIFEAHVLVTTGPYRLVRNPIYTGLLGLLIATGLTLSPWRALLGGIVVYLLGTSLRIRIEERLLHATFGAVFETYLQTVPALIPFPRPHGGGRV